MSKKFRLFFPCYFAFFSNGAMALLVGAILPYFMEEAKISYSAAGGILSVFAVGNLTASFINPIMARSIGRKATILVTSIWIPICFFTITLIPPLWVVYVMFFMCGVGRGSCSIMNNAVVNDNSGGKPAAINFLHMTFAFGAFSAPFLTTIYIGAGLNWRAIVYTIVTLSSLATIGYAWMKLDYNWPTNVQKQENGQAVVNTEYACFKIPGFYILGMLLFFYLGLENCVNGWFVTYFQNSGVMSDAYATNLVTLTWIMVLLGRFMTAKISAKVEQNVLMLIYCIVAGAFFLLLIATHNLVVITIAIAGIGFSMAGIYPTGVSCGGKYVVGSTTGMSMLLAMAALGGIITPKLVGMIADHFSITTAIMILVVNMVGMVVLAILNRFRSLKEA